MIGALSESIVEDAALTWFGELTYAVGHGPHVTLAEPTAERDCEISVFRSPSPLILGYSFSSHTFSEPCSKP